MSFLISLFNEILIRPLFNVLILFFHFSGDFGLAIILLTILIRVVLYPLSAKAIRSQKELSLIQPQIQEIQHKHKGNQATQAKELMKLYQEHGINPFSGCLPLLIQLPILIALYRVFLTGLDPLQLATVYYFLPTPATISPLLLGFLNLSQRSLLLAVSTALLQLWQSKISAPPKPINASKTDAPTLIGRQTLFILPAITMVIAASLPAGPVLYWFTTTLIAVAQHYLIKPKHHEHQLKPS